MPDNPIPRRRRLAGLALSFLGCAAALSADPLSKKTDVDFYRDVSSRNLRGLASRADGRLVAGPVFTELGGSAPAELFWCLEPSPDGKWLLGTGPDGGIFEVTLASDQKSYAARVLARVDDPQVFALRRLADGSILAGTSPRGGLDLVRDGKVVARTALPVDSIFDLLPLDGQSVLVATGNPGRIYRVALKAFAAAGVGADRVTDPAALAARGITLFGEIRDRNVRRIVRLPDGRIAAGSAPKGNVYLFEAPAAGASPAETRTGRVKEGLILQENHDAEVTDPLPEPDGTLYAAIVFGGGVETRGSLERTREGNGAIALPPAPPPEKFQGRSVLVRYPANGFPEVLASRSGVAFYRLARQANLILIAGGEQGDFSGYDLGAKFSLIFAGSTSARLNGLAPVPGAAGRFLALRNNTPGLALVDFGATGAREVETDPIDLGAPARIGALRFNRLRDLAERQLDLAIRTSNGSDESEGWSPWTPLADGDGGWRAASLRGRYAKLRLRWAADAPASAEMDRAALYYLPQDHRPVLQDFRLLPANFQIVPAAEPAPAVSTTLSQLLAGHDDEKRKGAILGSQVVAAPGMQAAYWAVADADGDNVACTFSIRRDGDSAWTDIAVATRDSYAQFDTSHLAEGLYFTRVAAAEGPPRDPAERLTATFETDHLLVDHTPPEILEASAVRRGDTLVVTVRGRDALSLLDGLEADFNNGARETVEQPTDGIRDGREKTFVLEEPAARAAGATSVEVTLSDAAGNSAVRRLTW